MVPEAISANITQEMDGFVHNASTFQKQKQITTDTVRAQKIQYTELLKVLENLFCKTNKTISLSRLNQAHLRTFGSMLTGLKSGSDKKKIWDLLIILQYCARTRMSV